VIDTFCSSPLSFEKRTGNKDGAIFGWSYQNNPMPVVHKMSKITKSIETHIPNIYQAGQWSFSPAGVPISIITGKLASDRVKKNLRKKT
jgi:phytoene dehydrogenase-like protein